MAVAGKHGIPVLEDCAQANGGSFRGRKLGTLRQPGHLQPAMEQERHRRRRRTAGHRRRQALRALRRRARPGHPLGQQRSRCPTGAVTWGSGRRMSELTGAVASEQLKKLPAIVRHMRASKRRIKAAAGRHARPRFPPAQRRSRRRRPVPGPAAGRRGAGRAWPSGCRPPDSPAPSAWPTTACTSTTTSRNWCSKVPLSPAGNPWSLPQNKCSDYDYHQGRLPAKRRPVRPLDPPADPLAAVYRAGDRGGEDHPRRRGGKKRRDLEPQLLIVLDRSPASPARPPGFRRSLAGPCGGCDAPCGRLLARGGPPPPARARGICAAACAGRGGSPAAACHVRGGTSAVCPARTGGPGGWDDRTTAGR